MLNLEWEAPQVALDWAGQVLAAYPDRIAIMATHSFVSLNGQRRTTAERPGGTLAERMWTDFVSQQCSIQLVLNGHFHNGNLGEANRSDLNRCGRPVQQILTDYQDRANGGDGWLRYYTFDPAANTMTATTYSPKLNQFETDADSAFTLPFDLSAPAAGPVRRNRHRPDRLRRRGPRDLDRSGTRHRCTSGAPSWTTARPRPPRRPGRCARRRAPTSSTTRSPAT